MQPFRCICRLQNPLSHRLLLYVSYIRPIHGGHASASLPMDVGSVDGCDWDPEDMEDVGEVRRSQVE